MFSLLHTYIHGNIMNLKIQAELIIVSGLRLDVLFYASNVCNLIYICI